jgi:hypothetical protein
MSDAGAAARALLERLGVATATDAPLDDVAAALAAREHDAPDRATKKEIRRLLYRLGQQGVAVPAAPPAAAPGTILGPAIEAFVSAVDGRGDRLVWLVREQPNGTLLLVAADVNEPAGLRDLRVLDATRGQLRAMRERFRSEAGLRFVPADWRALDALVLAAQDRLGADADRRLDYRRVRPRLTSEPPRAAAPLVSALAPAPSDAERPALIAESTALLGEPEFRSWWPDPERARPVIAEIASLRDSPIVLAPAQQETRLAEILAGAARTLYPGDVMAARLEATAYVLAESGRADAARRALAVAAALRADPDAAIPFRDGLVRQGLGAHLAAAEATRREERAGALVVTPDEAARARSPSRPPRPRA